MREPLLADNASLFLSQLHAKPSHDAPPCVATKYQSPSLPETTQKVTNQRWTENVSVRDAPSIIAVPVHAIDELALDPIGQKVLSTDPGRGDGVTPFHGLA